MFAHGTCAAAGAICMVSRLGPTGTHAPVMYRYCAQPLSMRLACMPPTRYCAHAALALSPCVCASLSNAHRARNPSMPAFPNWVPAPSPYHPLTFPCVQIPYFT